MEVIVSQKIIQLLWDALTTASSKKRSYPSLQLITKFLRDGWAFRSDFEDVIRYLEPRLDINRADLLAWVEAFGIKWEQVCSRPKVNAIEVSQFEAIRVEEAAQMLIYLEQLGLEVEPLLLVGALLPKIKTSDKKLLSNAELAIFWFERFRHKTEPIHLWVENQSPIQSKKQLKTTKGYLAEFGIDGDGKIVSLKVNAPKFRKTQEPIPAICKECGLLWHKGDPDSSSHHRKIHKRRMSYLDPQPNPKLTALALTGEDLVYVDSSSPLWMHQEMYARATAFKYELRFDFPQWENPATGKDTKGIGVLLRSEQNAIIGAICFRAVFSADKMNYYKLDWVWICPRERRKGHLAKLWRSLKEKFGDFLVSDPVSDGMLKFLKKHQDLELIKYPADRNHSQI